MLDSPPHIGLFVSISITMVGSLIVCAAARETGWGRAGLTLSIPVLVTFSPITAKAFDALPLPVEPDTVGTVFFATLLLITGTLTLGRPGTALMIAAALAGMQAFLWWFSPWAARVYADSVGLPQRDNLGDEPPNLPAEIPLFAVLGAGAISALLWLGRRRGWSGRVLPQVIGAVGGLLIALSMPVQEALLGGSRSVSVDLLPMAVVGVLAGALAGYLAARFAVLLRERPSPGRPAGPAEHAAPAVTKDR
ncbi:hypothetical protein [Streptomyces sp. NPDC049744]|uniref:hypothetical protein n=1 Tax=Streptomyces sp. NPDC049744 TaxID=3154359 RepID=UPI00342BC2FE